MVLIETVVTGIVDEFPRLGLNWCLRLLTTISVAVFFCCLGLPQTTQVLTRPLSNPGPNFALNGIFRLCEGRQTTLRLQSLKLPKNAQGKDTSGPNCTLPHRKTYTADN